MEAKTALVKYVFLDIVKYSFERSVEAQTDIINLLNEIVKETIQPFELSPDDLIFLPTGDGICICFINAIDPYDIHLQVALSILEKLNSYNSIQKDQKRIFNLRIGINENHDNIIVDINGRINVAGSGINYAQRIMNMADDNQIFIGHSVYEKLFQRERYNDKFKEIRKSIKHGISLTAYQYIDDNLEFLNTKLKIETIVEDTIPKKIAVYRFFVTFFEEEIIMLNGSGSNSYTLTNILNYMTEDYLKYESITIFERKKWESKIFDSNIDNFTKAYKKIESAYFWLICDSCKYYKAMLDLEKWSKLFKSEYLSTNKNYDKKVKRDWPRLSKEMSIYLPQMYPWLKKEDEEKLLTTAST